MLQTGLHRITSGNGNHSFCTGVDEDEVDKIFNERYKGRRSGNMAGEGIGMFLVRKDLRIMGADIRVAPESNGNFSRKK
jgi:K+-sensing histidine kinase KdpD